MPTISDFRKAAEAMKSLGIQEDVHLPIKNWILFAELLDAGKLAEVSPGIYDLK